MPDLVLFGTLVDAELRRIVAGADLPGRPARLPGRGLWQAAAGDWPVLAGGNGAEALVVATSEAVLARFDFYEAAFGYVRERAPSGLAGTEAASWIYRPATAGAASDVPWQLAAWQQRWGALTRAAAREAMAQFGQISPEELAFALPTMRMRAASRLRGSDAPAPVGLRAGLSRDHVDVVGDRRPYTGYFAVLDADIVHPHFAGGTSDVLRRSAWLCGDAVTVLPYDPARDRVLLVEQFRFGPFARGDRHPWSLEPIAGRIDPGESAEAAAHREAQEEAGLRLSRLIPVASYYPSPGAVTEYLYTYVGLADLPDEAAGLGGLDHEGEDIRAHVLSFARLEELIATGEIDNGPLLVSALWLVPRRAGMA